jgi:DDE superfamily endonuclease/Helix-turn-helix of DDE superfamily endonuclease
MRIGMICRFDYLRRYPTVFLKMTGLRLNEFASLLDDMLPRVESAQQRRLHRTNRRRAIGGGRHADLAARDQILLAVIWLRQYPTNEVLGFLFGVSDSTVSRLVNRIVPLLEASGKDTMRMPDPGRKHRKQLDTLLKETPELAVIIDTFEQRVQRCKNRLDADAHFSGKKKQHTLKGQVAIDEDDGTVCDVPESVVGPMADLTLLKESGLLSRLGEGVGAIGDLAYVGIALAHPQGLGACPRRKPRGKDRPVEDVCFNRAFAKRRIKVEHTIGRMRRYESLSHTDRHHRRLHTARTRAVAGLVNRQIRSRLPC